MVDSTSDPASSDKLSIGLTPTFMASELFEMTAPSAVVRSSSASASSDKVSKDALVAARRVVAPDVVATSDCGDVSVSSETPVIALSVSVAVSGASVVVASTTGDISVTADDSSETGLSSICGIVMGEKGIVVLRDQFAVISSAIDESAGESNVTIEASVGSALSRSPAADAYSGSAMEEPHSDVYDG